MKKISAHTKRKWWYRAIKSMNWVSFRYWWFIWLLFLLIILFFSLRCCKTEEKDCNYDFTNNFRSIDSLLYECCECDLLEEDYLSSPDDPSGTLPCDDSQLRTYSGSNVIHRQTYDIGSASGLIPICYNTGNMYPDNIKIFFNGEIIFESGNVLTQNQMDCKEIRYNYNSGSPTYIEVVIEPSNDENTQWTYTLGCPK